MNTSLLCVHTYVANVRRLGYSVVAQRAATFISQENISTQAFKKEHKDMRVFHTFTYMEYASQDTHNSLLGAYFSWLEWRLAQWTFRLKRRLLWTHQKVLRGRGQRRELEFDLLVHAAVCSGTAGPALRGVSMFLAAGLAGQSMRSVLRLHMHVRHAVP